MTNMIIKEITSLSGEEKKGFKSSGYYRGKNRCVKLREHDLNLVTEKNTHYDVAVTEKDILKNIFAGTFDKSELKDLVSQGVEDEFKAQEVTRDLARYLNSESRTPVIGEAKYFLIGDERVRVCPDFIFDDGQTLEVVFIRSSRPDVTFRGKKRDASVNSSLELWFGILYARAYRTELEKTDEYAAKRRLRSSYYFVRKDTDRAYGLYDTDFFSKSGKNVVFFDEMPGCEKDTDEMFISQMEEFIEGTDQCTPDDCKKCINRTSCEYQKAPEPFEIKENKKNGKITLSDAQSKIVAFRKGIARVIAKAGSGKTECSTEREAQMFAEGVDPKTFLAITFTDAGATEMKERITKKCEARGLAISGDDIKAMTFHKFGFDIIKDNYEMFGFTKKPIIVDTNDVIKRRLFNNILEEKSLYTLENKANLLDWALKVYEIIANNGLTPDTSDSETVRTISRAVADKISNANLMDQSTLNGLIEVADVFKEQCRKENYLTFADIEDMMNEALEKNPEYLNSLGIKHILVDEFQDSNDAQMKTIKLLISTECFESLMVVGDDSQSIYGFRNTSQENIIHFFEKLNVSGEDFRLEENRRSTPEILEFANKIDALNENRAGGDMLPVREHGFKPIVRAYGNRDEEYDFIIDQISKGIASGKYAAEDFAVIAFKRSELVAIAARLSQAGIPWITKYPMPLQDNSRVQAAVSLATAFYQPEAENLYFNYLVAENDGDIFEDMSNDEIRAKIEELKKEWKSMDYLEIGYQQKIFHEKLEAIKGNDEIYAYFLELVYENPDLQSELEFIRDFKRFGERCSKKLENDYAGVVLTTAHSSKGLEWPVVFNTISGYDDKHLHNTRKTEAIEERRRLLYVSVTRARDILYVTGKCVAYGKYGDYTYNQFLIEAVECSGKAFIPVLPTKQDQTFSNSKSNSNSKSKPKVKELTEEEKQEYERLAKNSVQMNLAEMI